MTEARRKWCESTIRQMNLAGYDPTDVLLTAFDNYTKGELSFYQLCGVMRDEGE